MITRVSWSETIPRQVDRGCIVERIGVQKSLVFAEMEESPEYPINMFLLSGLDVIALSLGF